MLYINILFLLFYAAVYVASLQGDKEWTREIDRKEHKLYFLYPMADFLMVKTGLNKRLHRKDRVTASIKALNVTSKPEMMLRLYWCSKISLVITILFLFHAFALMGELQSNSNSSLQKGNYLVRPENGEGSNEVDLNVTLELIDTKENTGKDKISNYTEDITIHLEERNYSEKELSEVFESAIQYLDISLMGNNESTDNIQGDLFFCKFIPGTSIVVEWKPEDTKLIGRDGKVHNDEITKGGVITTVSAVLSYQDKQMNYQKQLIVRPKTLSDKELLNKQLEGELETVLNKTKEEKKVELPDTMEDYALKWKDKKQYTGLKILIMGMVAAVIIWFYFDQELSQKMKKRSEQMLLDYPEIINKFTLLVNAGMTVKQAWNKVTQDYEKKTIAKGKKRYAYEEMLVTVHELKLGVAESEAYEHFGRRIGLISYMKFGSLISQNLKKGNKGLSELLGKEAREAFEERKEIAKRLGEEAGTKLLAPMMIMLLIVFMIILIPAFLSFRL